MKIAVFGLGYVGAVTAALLANRGHNVVGIDISALKVNAINSGESPVLEPLLPEIVSSVVADGRLEATDQPESAGAWQVAFVCVGTPSGAGGKLDPGALESVLQAIGAQVAERDDFPVVVIRSTVAPHYLDEIVIPKLENATGKGIGDGYGLATVPEFLREGSSVADFNNPPFTVVGCSDDKSFDTLSQVFEFIDAPLVRLSVGEAVMVKYASNAFHAAKIAFANEIGLMCAHQGLNSHRVMETFCLDQKLNVSAAYLRPGFAFGGSCLPKDLRELNYRARQTSLNTPVLNSILESNRAYLETCCDRVLNTGKKRIGILGISFKAGTDDLRESPMISLIEVLIGKGKELRIYDSTVKLDELTGTNREYIENAIPHIASLIQTDIDAVMDGSEVLVIGNTDPEFSDVHSRIRSEQILIDFSKPLDMS